MQMKQSRNKGSTSCSCVHSVKPGSDEPCCSICVAFRLHVESRALRHKKRNSYKSELGPWPTCGYINQHSLPEGAPKLGTNSSRSEGVASTTNRVGRKPSQGVTKSPGKLRAGLPHRGNDVYTFHHDPDPSHYMQQYRSQFTDKKLEAYGRRPASCKGQLLRPAAVTAFDSYKLFGEYVYTKVEELPESIVPRRRPVVSTLQEQYFRPRCRPSIPSNAHGRVHPTSLPSFIHKGSPPGGGLSRGRSRSSRDDPRNLVNPLLLFYENRYKPPRY
ncbi:PREDICTED: uncharacterized protein LOC106807072 [Priapulus caudatus]|uniref:Uncharacterized protein LOC106807072 n=1 Tax=Priapulus caudatus TaxID=37621 RepID=A0ABM1DXX4_PRICU|nr:PREDICTED: uncharacterized protein LOC106807072 [Priapulus caudatus]